MSRALLSYLDVAGPEYSYLGHFRQFRFLDQGHNDISEDDADEMDKLVEHMGSSRMPTSPSDKPQGA